MDGDLFLHPDEVFQTSLRYDNTGSLAGGYWRDLVRYMCEEQDMPAEDLRAFVLGSGSIKSPITILRVVMKLGEEEEWTPVARRERLCLFADCWGEVVAISSQGPAHSEKEIAALTKFCAVAKKWGMASVVEARLESWKAMAPVPVRLDTGIFRVAKDLAEVDTSGIFKHPVECIAETLVAMQSQIIYSITAADIRKFVDSTESHECQESPLMCADAFAKKISTIVQAYILGGDSVTLSNRLGKAIRLLGAVKEFNDFCTLHAVLSGLRASAISRLRAHWQKLGNHEKDMYRDTLALMSASSGYRNYRSQLKLAQKPLLPSMSVLETDVLHIGKKYLPVIGSYEMTERDSAILVQEGMTTRTVTIHCFNRIQLLGSRLVSFFRNISERYTISQSKSGSSILVPNSAIILEVNQAQLLDESTLLDFSCHNHQEKVTQGVCISPNPRSTSSAAGASSPQGSLKGEGEGLSPRFDGTPEKKKKRLPKFARSQSLGQSSGVAKFPIPKSKKLSTVAEQGMTVDDELKHQLWQTMKTRNSRITPPSTPGFSSPEEISPANRSPVDSGASSPMPQFSSRSSYDDDAISDSPRGRKPPSRLGKEDKGIVIRDSRGRKGRPIAKTSSASRIDPNDDEISQAGDLSPSCVKASPGSSKEKTRKNSASGMKDAMRFNSLFDRTLIFNDGRLLGGAFAEVVDYLITAPEYYKEEDLAVFIAGYRSVVDVKKMIHALEKALEKIDDDRKEIGTKYTRDREGTVGKLIDLWVDICISQKASAIQPVILDFLNRAAKLLQSWDVPNGVSEKINEISGRAKTSYPRFKVMPASKLRESILTIPFVKASPQSIAESIICLNRKYMDQVYCDEFFHYCRSGIGPRSPNLESLRKLSAQVASLVSTQTFRSTPSSGLKKFITVARKLFKMNDFQGLVAVLRGLEAAPVSRLANDWNKLSSKYIQHYAFLKSFMAEEDDYAIYRSHIDNVKGPCVPYVPLFCDDLLKSFNQLPNDLDGSSKVRNFADLIGTPATPDEEVHFLGQRRPDDTSVNFEKICTIGKSIMGFLHLIDRKYSITEQPDIVEAIRSLPTMTQGQLLDASYKAQPQRSKETSSIDFAAKEERFVKREMKRLRSRSGRSSRKINAAKGRRLSSAGNLEMDFVRDNPLRLSGTISMLLPGRAASPGASPQHSPEVSPGGSPLASPQLSPEMRLSPTMSPVMLGGDIGVGGSIMYDKSGNIYGGEWRELVQYAMVSNVEGKESEDCVGFVLGHGTVHSTKGLLAAVTRAFNKFKYIDVDGWIPCFRQFVSTWLDRYLCFADYKCPSYVVSFLSEVDTYMASKGIPSNFRLRILRPERKLPIMRIALSSPCGIYSLPPNLQEATPQALSHAILYMENAIAQQLHPVEFQDGGGWSDPDKCPNLVSIAQLFNKINALVQIDVINGTQGDPTTRIKKYILVARLLYKLNDFNGLLAILSGLNSLSVLRLRSHWRKLPSKYTDIFSSLENVMSAKSGYKMYRSSLRSCGRPVMPYMALILRDLTYISDGNPKYIAPPEEEGKKSTGNEEVDDEEGGKANSDRASNKAKKERPINLQRIVMYGNRVNEFFSFVKVPYELDFDKDLVDGIKGLNLIDEDIIYEESLKLEPKLTSSSSKRDTRTPTLDRNNSRFSQNFGSASPLGFLGFTASSPSGTPVIPATLMPAEDLGGGTGLSTSRGTSTMDRDFSTLFGGSVSVMGFDSFGQKDRGSLAELVEYLLAGVDTTLEENMKPFLYGFGLKQTARDLCEAVEGMLNKLKLDHDDGGMDPKYLLPRQRLLVKFITIWMEELIRKQDICEEEFVSLVSAWAPRLTKWGTENDLLNSLEEIQRLQRMGRIPHVSGLSVTKTELDILKTPPELLAKGIMALESQVVEKLSPAEIRGFLSDVGPLERSRHCTMLLSIYDRVTYMVRSTVTLSTSSSVSRHFVGVAELLYQNNDFNGLLAVLDGLGHVSIKSTKSLWKKSKRLMHTYKGLVDLMSSANDYQKYRTRLTMCKKPKLPCIPILISDLRKLESRMICEESAKGPMLELEPVLLTGRLVVKFFDAAVPSFDFRVQDSIMQAIMSFSEEGTASDLTSNPSTDMWESGTSDQLTFNDDFDEVTDASLKESPDGAATSRTGERCRRAPSSGLLARRDSQGLRRHDSQGLRRHNSSALVRMLTTKSSDTFSEVGGLVYHGRNGSLLRGTPVEVVYYLLSPDRDEQTLRTFALGYTSVFDAEDVFRLIDGILPDLGETDSLKPGPTLETVHRFLHVWVKTHLSPCPPWLQDVLVMVDEFGGRVATSKLPWKKHTSQKPWSKSGWDSLPIDSPGSKKSLVTVSSFMTSGELAEKLYAIHAHLLKALHPSEFHNYVGNGPKSGADTHPTIDMFEEIRSKLACFVVIGTTIGTDGSVLFRLKKFISLAKAAWKLRDYNTVVGILEGLSTKGIQNSKAWSQLDRKYLGYYIEMMGLLDESNGYNRYTAHEEGSNHSILSVVLSCRIIHFIQQKWPRTLRHQESESGTDFGSEDSDHLSDLSAGGSEKLLPILSDSNLSDLPSTEQRLINYERISLVGCVIEKIENCKKRMPDVSLSSDVVQGLAIFSDIDEEVLNTMASDL